MIRKISGLVLLCTVFVIAPSTARGDDVDDLKAVVTQVIDGINSLNVDALETTWHDNVTTVMANAPFPVTGKAANREAWGSFFGATDKVTLTTINPQYSVIGNTGIVEAFYSVTIWPKNGPMRTEFGRYTGTYVKSDGKWLRVAGHASHIPSGD